MRFPKSSGVLLHITSLPTRLSGDHDEPDFSIGDLGAAAFEFVDSLKRSGQKVWQILPVCPTGKGNSPYSSYSAFAGNQLLINIPLLIKDGWLDSGAQMPSSDANLNKCRVNFEAAQQAKTILLSEAFDQSRARLDADQEFQSFCESNVWWLEEFARYEALMWHLKEPNWTTWPDGLATRDADALARWDKKLADEIKYSKFVQFLFHVQWNRLKDYANANDVKLYGDMPIFVAHESADVWAHQHLFELDESGKSTVVAGVPPDYFSETGQLWGNPLYRWDVMESNDFAWWTSRFRRALEQFDYLRVDHFRGFESYWEVPASAKTAMEGSWKLGPLHKPFEAAEKVLGPLPIIAEDLGMITEKVHQLRERLDFPPMRVLQFGFSSVEDDFHRPSTYPEHCVAYTGTHDNDTLMGWHDDRRAKALSSHEKDPLEDLLNSHDEVHWQLINMVISSAADTVITPIQDVLGLGNEARMNVPGVADGNWSWRMKRKKLTSDVESKLLTMTQNAKR